MKKRHLIPIAGAVGASVAAYYLNKNRKNSNDEYSTFENAGKPDQSSNNDLAQLENAKMVSEGSQFGVQYYTKVRSEESSDDNDTI